MSLPQISRRMAGSALAIIFIANFFSYLDRQLVSALENEMSRDLALSPKQFGLLWSLFTVGYMVFAFPIGFLADRYNRPRILAACIVIWSAATVASGMATSLPVLYGSRFLIGMGEAGCLIIGQSLIADYFAAGVRGRALSLFHLAVPIGGTAAFIMAGALRQTDWRNLFYIAGFPGIVIAVFILLLRDPPRGAGELGAHGGGRSHGFRGYLQLLKNRTLILLILSQAFAVILLVNLIHFGAKFFAERLSLPDKDAKLAMGIMALVAGGLGSFLSGILGDKLSKKTKGAYALMSGIAFLCGLPCLLVGFNATDKWVALPALTAGAFCIFLCMPAINTQIANVTHPTQRATAWALAIFMLHLLGDTTAPVVFGMVSESIGRLQTFTMFSFALVGAGVCCLFAARSSARDIERIELQNSRVTPDPKSVV